jgi:hypothetical protein
MKPLGSSPLNETPSIVRRQVKLRPTLGQIPISGYSHQQTFTLSYTCHQSFSSPNLTLLRSPTPVPLYAIRPGSPSSYPPIPPHSFPHQFPSRSLSNPPPPIPPSQLHISYTGSLNSYILYNGILSGYPVPSYQKTIAPMSPPFVFWL